MRVARKLRDSALQSCDAEYTELFLRAAEALEDRATQLAYHPSDLEMPETETMMQDDQPSLYRHVDLRC